MSRTARVWVASELFHPERTSTGEVMTAIALGIAEQLDVGVVCAQPTYSARGTRAERRELLDGRVEIFRVRSTTFGKGHLAGRLVDLGSISIATFLSLLFRLRRDDVVLVVTNPPALPYLALVAAKLRNAKLALVVHDLFPEVLDVGRKPSRLRSLVVRVLDRLSVSLYQGVDSIVVIGSDQADRIEAKVGGQVASKICCIPIAHDAGFDGARLRDGSEHFRSAVAVPESSVVFQFAGNMGPLQGGEFLVQAVSQARDANAHFDFVGAGRNRHVFERSAESMNVTFSDWVPRDRTPDLHAGCDVIVISLVRGMGGISVPSRIGNALASGRPILGIVDEGSELDRIISRHGVGWSVRPGDFDGFWSAVSEALDKGERDRRSAACLRLARDRYAPERSVTEYDALVRDLTRESP